MKKELYSILLLISLSCNKQPDLKSQNISTDKMFQNDSSIDLSEKANLKNQKILQTSNVNLKELSLIMLSPNFNPEFMNNYKYLVEIKTLYNSERQQFSSDEKMKKLDDFEKIINEELLKSNLDVKYIFRIRQAGISYYYLASNDTIKVKEKLNENINENFVSISIQKNWNVYKSALERTSKK